MKTSCIKKRWCNSEYETLNDTIVNCIIGRFRSIINGLFCSPLRQQARPFDKKLHHLVCMFDYWLHCDTRPSKINLKINNLRKTTTPPQKTQQKQTIKKNNKY
jgi:hypothetical protein